jgi:formylglycine-generating enzyme required for sulfatase activity
MPKSHKAAYRLVLPGIFFLALVAIAGTQAAPGKGWTGSVAASQEVFVPAGQFYMGCTEDLAPPIKCDTDNRPIHPVYLDAFYIDRAEVTNVQYAACVTAGVCPSPLENSSESRPDYFTNPRYAEYPVINVDWNRANAYCQWIGRRLPTEAEWEKAARGTDLRAFPWGNELPTCERANINDPVEEGGPGLCVGDTITVGLYMSNASPYGALDMVGNVSEWVNDLYESRYYQHSPYYNPQGPSYTVKGEHLVRGGAWNNVGDVNANVWVRLDESETYHYKSIGFRCAKSAGPGGTPTPTPVPTPTPTPLPAPASRSIGPEGGLIWQSYPSHLTVLNIPQGAVTTTTVFTIQYDVRGNQQQGLEGVEHFFSIDSPPGFQAPLNLTLGYPEKNPLISNTLRLYRLDAANWVTGGITLTRKASGALSALIDQSGFYGVLGETNHIYLPVVLRR